MPSDSSRTFLEQATATYYRALKTEAGTGAVEYLKTRGLSGVSVKSLRLGYVGDPLPGHEAYHGRLAIPYLTRSGVVTMRFRAIPPSDSPAKYLSMPGDEPRLYNPNDLGRRESFVCICEGEFDTATAHQTGLPAVGVAGVNGWRPYFARCFHGYEAVYILCDNDDKGQGEAFGQRVAEQVPNARIVLMPKGHDVNSFVLASGPDALLAKVGTD